MRLNRWLPRIAGAGLLGAALFRLAFTTAAGPPSGDRPERSTRRTADGPVETVGLGSHLRTPPAGAPRPPGPARRLGSGPVPTNRFWSSLVGSAEAQPHYPHPLAVHPSSQGLRIAAPAIAVDPRGLSAVLDVEGRGEDLTLTGSGMGEIADIAIEDFGDWTVRVGLSDGTSRLSVTYGHGSPYVYGSLAAGGARIDLPDEVKVWAGDGQGPTLGITVRGRHYGLFGPGGSTWSGLGTRTLTNQPGPARHFSLALLPAATPEVLARFARHAHAHVTGSRAAWRFDPKTATVTTAFTVDLEAREGAERATLLALYPHQWGHTTAATLPGLAYETVRGPMRLVEGAGFTTSLSYPGILPALPPVAPEDPVRRARLLEDELARAGGPPLDAYFEGKLLGRLAAQVPLVEAGDPAGAARLVAALEKRLERRFRAVDAEGRLKPDRLDYEPAWGALIARPGAFGNDTELNDHHLQYGYYLRAAAEIAARDPAWIADERWGGMVRLIARDVASADRADPLFPYLRSFDAYAGHSWASGLARFPAGNNLESSSEAMNAWAALLLLGQALGDVALRDLGAFLYTTELSAIEAYWFDVERRTFPPTLTPPALSLIWGGKGRLETWFSEEPEALFGINWLPLHGGSLYLGRYPEAADRVYRHLRGMRKSEAWALWPDLVIMYRALSDPADASRQLDRLGHAALPEAGNSRLGLEAWVGGLVALGQVDRTITADVPLYGVFRRGARRVHAAYRMAREPAFVATFSDGATLRCDRPGFTHDLR